jgi:dUTP pyrophosphatase
MKEIVLYKLHQDAKLPTRNLSTDSGLDLYALQDTFIPVGTTVTVKTGVTMNIHDGYTGQICDRSSVAKNGLITGGGIIDPGYSGDYSVILHNLTNRNDYDRTHRVYGYQVKKHDRIAQLLILPISTPKLVEINKLWISERSDKSFGSSGR